MAFRVVHTGHYREAPQFHGECGATRGYRLDASSSAERVGVPILIGARVDSVCCILMIPFVLVLAIGLTKSLYVGIVAISSELYRKRL